MDVIVIMCVVLFGVCNHIHVNLLMLISFFVISLLYFMNDCHFMKYFISIGSIQYF